MDVGRYFSTQSCVRLMVFVASCGGGVAIGGLWSLARFSCAALVRRRELQRAPVVGGLLDCASWQTPAMVSIARRPLVVIMEFELSVNILVALSPRPVIAQHSVAKLGVKSQDRCSKKHRSAAIGRQGHR